MGKVLHIDGDILPYKIGFATQRCVYRLAAEGLHTCSSILTTMDKTMVNKWVKADPTILVHEYYYLESKMQAIISLKNAINNIIIGAEGDHLQYKVVLSGKENFRTKVATIQPYKGNRKDFVKPGHWEMLRDYLLDKPYTVVAEGEEADDVLSKALMQGHPIATIDKDLDNTPGVHYNFNKKLLYEVTPEEAMRNFYTQILTGDVADHIPGIKGIGPVKAKKILAHCTREIEYENAIRPHYEKVYNGLWFEALTEVGRLLWMRRVDNEMWHPVMGSHLEVVGGDDYDEEGV